MADKRLRAHNKGFYGELSVPVRIEKALAVQSEKHIAPDSPDLNQLHYCVRSALEGAYIQ